MLLICVLALGLAGPGALADAKPLRGSKAKNTAKKHRKRSATKARKRTARKRTVRKRTVRKRRTAKRTVRKRRVRKRKYRSKRRVRKRSYRSKRRARKGKRIRNRRKRARRRRRRRRRRYQRLPTLPKQWSYPPSAPMARRGFECLRSLTQLNVKWRRANRIGRIATPVEIRDANLAGVKIVSVFTRRTVMDCHLARAFAMHAKEILALGITEIHYSSIHRHSHIPRSRRLSRHNLGLAVDIRSMGTKKGKTLVVVKHYWRSRALRKFVRIMKKTELFRSILHPGNDRRHRDHFHMEAKMHTTQRY